MGNYSHHIWTEKRVSELKELLDEKFTFLQIAELLSVKWGIPLTRNSIAGACHRYRLKVGPRPKGLMNMRSDRRIAMEPAIKKKQLVRLKKVRKVVEQKAALPVPVHAPIGCSIMELRPSMCRYPMWHDRDRPTNGGTYCGTPKIVGAYCQTHAGISYRPIVASKSVAPLPHRRYGQSR